MVKNTRNDSNNTILLATSIIAMFLASIFLVGATPYKVSDGGSDPITGCTEYIAQEKVFTAITDNVKAGLVCSSNAKVALYNCNNADCTDVTKIDTGYKVNNVLPLFNGFNIGTQYMYRCYECQETMSSCPVTVKEGDLVKITWKGSDPDKNIGPQGKLTYEYTGPIGPDGTWQTKKGDAGIHYATARVFDGEFWDETQLCIDVIAVNEPPKLTVVSNDITVYEGDTVTIDSTCVDPEGDKVTTTYSGWMNSNTRSTGYDDAGKYDVTVTCTDTASNKAIVDVIVTVLNRNRPPVITWQKG